MQSIYVKHNASHYALQLHVPQAHVTLLHVGPQAQLKGELCSPHVELYLLRKYNVKLGCAAT